MSDLKEQMKSSPAWCRDNGEIDEADLWDDVIAELAALRAENERLQDDYDSLEGSVEKRQRELAALRAENISTRERANRIAGLLESMRDENERLEAELNAYLEGEDED